MIQERGGSTRCGGWILAMTGALACFALSPLQSPLGSAQAEVQPAKSKPSLTVPLPPTRPVQPAAVSPVLAPSLLAPPAVAPPQPTPTEGLLQPRKLPPASRARMHACGLEWQNMKRAGTAVDKTWLDFALACLTR